MAKTSTAKPAAKKPAAARTSSKPAVKAASRAVPTLAKPAARRPARSAAPVVAAALKAGATGAARAAPKPAARAAPKAPVPKTPVPKNPVPAAPPVKSGARAASRTAGMLTAPAAKRVAKAATAALKAIPDSGARPTLVRDSFTMPEQEYAVLAEVKKACLKAGVEIKKSELLRIGVALVRQLDLASLQSVLASLPQLKTGRPRSA